MSFGSKSTQSTNQTRDPWAPAQPALQQTISGLQGYMNDPNSSAVYSGDRVAQMSGATQSGINALQNSSGYDQSRDYVSRTLGGDYLNAGNPYVKQVQDQVAASVMPGMNATFARAGMNGSTQHQGMLAQGLANGMAQPLFQNYENERNRQQQASTLLPAMDQAYAQNLLTAGQTGEAYQQRNLDSAQQVFNENRDAALRPYQQTYPILGSIAGQGGTTQGTTTNTQTPGTGQMVLGGAMALGSLAGGMPTGGLSGMASSLTGNNGFQGILNNAMYGNNGLPWAAKS